MKRRIIRTAALAFASFSLLAACKKGGDEAPSESAAPSGPIEVAPVPVEQDGVFRYADEIVTAGQAKTNAVTSVLKGADATSTVVASIDADVVVEKKARRGDHVLVSWTATPGQPSMGWAPTSSLTDQAPEPVILPVDASAPTAPDAGEVADAGKADTAADAGQADAGQAATDAGAQAEKDEQAAADAGTDATQQDAGSSETAEAADAGKDESEAKADAGASDAGTGMGGKLIRLPIKQQVPVLKLPGKLELKPKE